MLDYFSGGMESDTDANFEASTGTTGNTTIDPNGLFVTKNVGAAEGSDFFGSIGTMFKYGAEGALEAAKYPFLKVEEVYEDVKNTTKSVFLYLIGGVAIVGILAIVLMGAGARFMAKVEGR
jgi:hypothetical protein